MTKKMRIWSGSAKKWNVKHGLPGDATPRYELDEGEEEQEEGYGEEEGGEEEAAEVDEEIDMDEKNEGC